MLLKIYSLRQPFAGTLYTTLGTLYKSTRALCFRSCCKGSFLGVYGLQDVGLEGLVEGQDSLKNKCNEGHHSHRRNTKTMWIFKSMVIKVIIVIPSNNTDE